MKETWALGHSRHLGTRSLEALRYSKGTWALMHLRHLDTRALEGHLGSRGILFSRLYSNSVGRVIVPSKTIARIATN